MNHPDFYTTVRMNLNDDWKLFALFFSIRKFFPDSNLYFSINGWDDICLRWTRRPWIHQVNKQPFESFKLPLESVAVRVHDTIHPCSARSTENSSFVNYSDGVGSWSSIDNTSNPLLDSLRRFSTPADSINEVLVLSIWESAGNAYKMLRL